jgi:starvation-inducible DNA-binding protein
VSKSSVANRAFSSRVSLSSEHREELTNLLNQLLADTSDLYSQTKQAHWNVKGLNFFGLHKLFDELAGMVEPYVDKLAERVTALGGMAMGTVRMAASQSRLPEYSADHISGEEHVRSVLERFARVDEAVRQGIRQAEDQWEDPVTVDMLTDLAGDLEQSIYFLESHLQK